jgi:hypothetical protein
MLSLDWRLVSQPITHHRIHSCPPHPSRPPTITTTTTTLTHTHTHGINTRKAALEARLAALGRDKQQLAQAKALLERGMQAAVSGACARAIGV